VLGNGDGGFSLKIESGQRVAIVGRTGAGKSSIVTALYRLAEPCCGRILIGGDDVTKISVAVYRQYVEPQPPFQF
jgi:ABC-type multidrug transport system fused ATPase/permease subunit